VEVFYPTLRCFLFPKFVLDASWLASAKAFCVCQDIGLEKCPKKVICDLMLLKTSEAYGALLASGSLRSLFQAPLVLWSLHNPKYGP
jgi:hypothetical protein